MRASRTTSALGASRADSYGESLTLNTWRESDGASPCIEGVEAGKSASERESRESGRAGEARRAAGESDKAVRVESGSLG